MHFEHHDKEHEDAHDSERKVFVQSLVNPTILFILLGIVRAGAVMFGV